MYSVVRNLLVQKHLGDRRAPWMTALQEDYLEIKYSLVVGGQGNSKLAAESTHVAVDDTDVNIYRYVMKK